MQLIKLYIFLLGLIFTASPSRAVGNATYRRHVPPWVQVDQSGSDLMPVENFR